MYKKTKALNARSEALNRDFNVRIGDFYKTEQILNEPKTICIKVTNKHIAICSFCLFVHMVDSLKCK